MEFTFYMYFAEAVLEKGIRAAAEYARKMGFSSVEMLETARTGCPKVFPTVKDAREARKVLEEYGLHMACYSVGAALYRSPEAEAVMMRHAEIAAELGSPYLHHTMVGSAEAVGAPSNEEAIEVVTDAAERIANYAKTLGLTCIYEDQGRVVNGIDGFGSFYREISRRCDNTGVCGDIGNCLFVDTEPEDFFRAYAKEIVHVHIKDYIRKSAPSAPGSGWHRTNNGRWLRDTTIGSGCIDFDACLKILKDAGYTGPYALELCHPEPFDYGVEQAMEYLRARA
ncbi:MAG: sugar phosphate isomerase/epimerase [Oscillospiraceae bacterium]|nr:sugar phosphate isomerase/epimerase [Oscillospiraceae bacterium]